jgi:hypothetical protein
MLETNFLILPRPKHVKLFIKTKLWGKFFFSPSFQLRGFDKHVEKMVPQPGSSTSLIVGFFIHPKVVACSLPIPLAFLIKFSC